MQYRPVRPAELPAALALMLALIQEETGRVPPEAGAALAEDVLALQASGRGQVVVAVDPEQVVGVIQVALAADPGLGEYVSLNRFYVLPAYRRRASIGWQLAKAALALVAADDLPVLITTTKPLPRSYAKLGFSPFMVMHAASLAETRARLARR